MRRANILKPQNAFDLKPDNFDTSPWKPILSTKPHASLPLEDSLGPFDDDEHTVQYDYTLFLTHALAVPVQVEQPPIPKGNQAVRERRYRNKKIRAWKDLASR